MPKYSRVTNFKNDADAAVLEIPTGTTNVVVAGNVTATGDLVVTGNDITFGNSETISNSTGSSYKRKGANCIGTAKMSFCNFIIFSHR